MDTDIFFQEYYREVRSVRFFGKPILSKIDKVLAVLVAVGLIMYVVLLLLSIVIPAIFIAVVSFVIVIYLSIKTSRGKARETILENRKNYQHSRFIKIREMLTTYKIDDDDSIDMLNESLALNKEKYNYGRFLRAAVKSVVGVVSVILSALSIKTFTEEINVNLVDMVFEDETILQKFPEIVESYASLILYAGLLILLIFILSVEVFCMAFYD